MQGRKHFSSCMVTKTICVLLCIQSFPYTKHYIFNKHYFHSRSFQKYSRNSVENSRTFQGYRTIFHFSRTFQGHDAFSRTFQGLCEPCYRVRSRAVTKGQALGISSGYYEHDHRLFSCKCPQSSFIHSEIFQSDRI